LLKVIFPLPTRLSRNYYFVTLNLVPELCSGSVNNLIMLDAETSL